MVTVRVSEHAVERYLERIDGSLTRDEARAALERASGAVEAAIAFGAPIVVMGNGARLCVSRDDRTAADACVTTVLRRLRRGQRPCDGDHAMRD